MFDMKLKFETQIRVKLLSREFEEMMHFCCNHNQLPYSETTVEHTMTITDAEAIPDKEWIDKSAQIIFETMKESLQKSKNVNATAISTKFVGFTEIVQK